MIITMVSWQICGPWIELKAKNIPIWPFIAAPQRVFYCTNNLCLADKEQVHCLINSNLSLGWQWIELIQEVLEENGI